MKVNKYHKRFLDSFTSENIMGLFSRYNNANKEITESWAMLEAAKMVTPSLSDYKVVVVGDGASPRTGAMFAYFTKAEVTSVDPNANMFHWAEHVEKQTGMGYPPSRLKFIKKRIEDIKIDCEGKPVIVVWPHSHADMNKADICGYEHRIDISMPCCVPIPANWMSRPHITYTDYNVLSPKRDIHIWN